MTTLLISGAGGFVGSHVLEHALRETDWDIIALDSFTHNGGTDRVVDAVIATGAHTSLRRATVLRHDLGAPFTTRQLDGLRDVDYVIDCASRCQVDESIADPAAFIINNVATTAHMLDAARAMPGLRAFLHLSTDEVYGSGEPQTSSDHWPSSPYAASKAAQEDICRAYKRTYSLPVGIVSSCNMFGERQSQLAYIPRIIRALITGTPLTVHLYPNRPPPSRYYTYVGNVAAYLVCALQDWDHDAGSHAQLGGQALIDNVALTYVVEDQYRKYVGRAVDDLDRQAVDVEYARPGGDDMYAPLEPVDDWQPSITFEGGLARTVRWFTGNPQWLT